MNKNEIRYNATHNRIKEVYKEMLCKYDLKNITVSEITKQVGINRKTFYIHYETIEDLINDVIKEVLEGYINAFSQLPEGRLHEVANRLFFEYFSKQEEYVQRIMCYSGFDYMCDIIFDTSYKKAETDLGGYPQYNEEENKLIATYYKVTTLGLYRKWILDGRKMSLEEVIELSNKLICKGVYAL